MSDNDIEDDIYGILGIAIFIIIVIISSIIIGSYSDNIFNTKFDIKCQEYGHNKSTDNNYIKKHSKYFSIECDKNYYIYNCNFIKSCEEFDKWGDCKTNTQVIECWED